jgi:hypothetical protein
MRLNKTHVNVLTNLITILPTKRFVTDGQPPFTRQCRGGWIRCYVEVHDGGKLRADQRQERGN